MIKVNPETYIQPFTAWPEMEMSLAGWTYEVKYFLFVIPYVVYHKSFLK
jgi:hypothetical protein